MPRLELPRLELPRLELPRHEPPRHEPPRHELPRLELPRHEPPRHELPRHELSRHEPPRHEPPRHEPPRHESSRHEQPRHEPPRHEPPRNEPRWEQSEKQFRGAEKDSNWDDLPEDARDPLGDDPLPPPPKETRPAWNNQPSQVNQQPLWVRDKNSTDNWSNKQTFPIGGPQTGPTNPPMNMQLGNLSMNMNNMNNMNQNMWQPGPPQTQPQNQMQNRNTNWLPAGNWHGISGPIGNVPSNNMNVNNMAAPNPMNHWQPQPQSQMQQSFADFSARLFNPSNPYMNNRR